MTSTYPKLLLAIKNCENLAVSPYPFTMPVFSQPVSLPLDILETIIGEFAVENDAATLKSCSLVSHIFHSLCRKHIFSKIELDSRVQRSGTSEVQKFKRLLDNDLSIAHHVRSLEYTNRCDGKAAPPILKHFRRVTSFTLRFLGGTQEWKTMPLSFKKSLASFMLYNKLDNLVLFSIHGVPAGIFPCMPHLSTLTLYDVTLTDTPLQGKFFRAKRSPSLVSLFIKDSKVRSLCRHAHSNGPEVESILDLTRLEKLAFGADDPHAMDVIKQLLKFPETLRCLALSGSDPDINVEGALSSDLNPAALQTLKTLDLRPMLETQEEDPYLGLALELEKIAGKNNLEEIILRIGIETDHRCTTEVSRWNRLDQVLSHKGGFPSLRSLDIKVTLYHFCRDLAEFQMLLEEIGRSCFPSMREDENIHFNYEVAIEDV